MSGYDDYPECLLRYAWLVEEGDGRNLFIPEPYSRCKACGALVPLAEPSGTTSTSCVSWQRFRKNRVQTARRESAARAGAAEAALDTFTQATYGGRLASGLVDEDRQSALSDLLCDLRHYAEREGFDFDAELAIADQHFAHESAYGWDEEVPA